MDKDLIRTKYNDASIYQSKPLIEACKKFDINEGRLFYLGLLELRPQLAHGKGQEKFSEVIIPTTDVIKLFGGNPGYYTKLKNVAKRLIDHSITVRDDDNNQEFKYISIFDMLHFDKKLGGLHIKFNDTMRPYILELADKPYTKIAVKTIFALNSHYAIRLMELMLEYQNIAEFKRNRMIKRKIMIKDLRFYCGINDSKYNTTTNFTQNVVARPCKEINASTPYEISYAYVKKGRMIIGYDFTLKVPDINESVETIEQLVESNKKTKIKKAVKTVEIRSSEENIYASLLSYGIGKIVAKRLVAKYSRERIYNNIEYVNQRKKIKNVGAYLRTAIENDYYSTKNLPIQRQMKIQEDVTKSVKEELAALGFGPVTSNMLVSAANDNGGFSLTDENICRQAGIEPDSLFQAIKNNDFSRLARTEDGLEANAVQLEESKQEEEQSSVSTSNDEKYDMQEIFISTVITGGKVTMDFVKKAATLGINLADLANTLGMSIRDCIKVN